MTNEEKRVFEKALYRFGPSQQKMKLLEEMAELQIEICHHAIGRGDLDKIADEMADVQIMLDQMTLFFQNGGLVQQHRARKVQRLAARLFEMEEGRDAAH